ncbi:NrsF family protein [Mesorhizobium sp. 1M-11]|uniref:NrsF family protein n=1 Tax=Mesorhizobium sp. 1M-11 TaxID=1529006 RepID=UPI0006C74FA5|nr:NrsF family protein [Mesorhizobium sp. 1M-11]
MDTNKLVEALVADIRKPGPSLAGLWWTAAVFATLLAGVVFFITLGPRPDIAEAAETPRFLFKFAVTMALATAAFGAARALSRPGSDWRHTMVYLIAAPAMLLAAVAVELVLVPPTLWGTRLVGTNSLVCLTFIPLIGAGPLVVFLAVLRHGAPTCPRLAGAVAGLLAGGIAATFYAAQCIDDSPLFVVTWYPIAIGLLAGLGALAGERILRW